VCVCVLRDSGFGGVRAFFVRPGRLILPTSVY
jgi:hypothetical protein